MKSDTYRLLYDVAEYGLSTTHLIAMGIFSVLTVALLGYLVHSALCGVYKNNLKAGIFLIAIAGVGGFVSYSFVENHRTCIRWLASGDYQVAAGQIADYEAQTRAYRFQVGEERFSIRKADLSKCGYRVTLLNEGEIHEGQTVRIAHRAGLILRIEAW